MRLAAARRPLMDFRSRGRSRSICTTRLSIARRLCLQRTAAASAGSSGIEEQALTKAAASAARRRIAAQTSLFDLANQNVVNELREADVDAMSEADAKTMLEELKKKLL